VKPENVLLGAGSTQILVSATHLYTGKDKAVVGSLPTYEECFGYAALIGSRTKAVPLTSDFRMDLDKTLYAVKGAGMLFYCNPNNPVATLVNPSDSKEFLPRALKASKDLRILVDEAYIDYVTTPGHETMIPMAVQEPRLIVARTFSKAYGMAGLRVGYAIAHESTIKELEKFHLGNTLSGLSYTAVLAALDRDASDPAYIPNEGKRNTEARAFTLKWFADRGYKATDAQANFTFVDVAMPIEEFQAGCAKGGVRVGRPFPPYWTHCRISIGTMDEMQRAVQVFDKVLAEGKAKAA
jgi:histidinol-phosphate aminotransferase